jgi:hypothetical protein
MSSLDIPEVFRDASVRLAPEDQAARWQRSRQEHLGSKTERHFDFEDRYRVNGSTSK